MDLDSLLLLIAWLLWTIHRDLTDSNDRALGLKTTWNQVASGLERVLGTTDSPGRSALEEFSTATVDSASEARLQTLRRIGTVAADHIIAARPFRSVEELRGVRGIPTAIFTGIKQKVRV